MSLKRVLQLGIVLIILLNVLQWLFLYDSKKKPSKLSIHSYGFFPLYETNFVKTVTLNQPYLLWVSIRIETLTPFNTDLTDVRLKLEAIKEDQVLGSLIIQGNTFKRLGIEGSESQLDNQFDVVRISQKSNTPESPLDCFKYQERCSYRITVIQPCEKYESVKTELWVLECN